MLVTKTRFQTFVTRRAALGWRPQAGLRPAVRSAPAHSNRAKRGRGRGEAQPLLRAFPCPRLSVFEACPARSVPSDVPVSDPPSPPALGGHPERHGGRPSRPLLTVTHDV